MRTCPMLGNNSKTFCGGSMHNGKSRKNMVWPEVDSLCIMMAFGMMHQSTHGMRG